MNRVRQPFNVNSLALAAATAALDDMEFVARSYAENLQGMQQIEEGARALGLEYIPSHGNFITVRVGKAAEIYKRLLKRGVIVRPVGGGYGCPSTCASPSARAEENETLPGRARRQPEGHDARDVARHRRRPDRRLVRAGAEAGQSACRHVVGVGRNAANLQASRSSAASSIRSRRTRRPRRAARTWCWSRRRSRSFATIFAALGRDSKRALVTDAGSTKRDVVAAARKALGKQHRAVRAGASDRRRREERRRRGERRAVPRPARRPHAAGGEPRRRDRSQRRGRVGSLRRARVAHGRRRSTTRCSPR